MASTDFRDFEEPDHIAAQRNAFSQLQEMQKCNEFTDYQITVSFSILIVIKKPAGRKRPRDERPPRGYECSIPWI